MVPLAIVQKKFHGENLLTLDGTSLKKGDRGCRHGENWSEDQFVRVSEGPGLQPATLIMGYVLIAARAWVLIKEA